MFKKVFESLSKTFTNRDEASKTADTSAPAGRTKPAPEKKTSILDKLSGGIATLHTENKPEKKAEKKPEKKKFFARKTPSISPEELCGVTSAMNKEQIRSRLAMLYRRHNRATSSLDAKLRDEAERMLTAVVTVREKHFGPI
jgi:hypothetical protein